MERKEQHYNVFTGKYEEVRRPVERRYHFESNGVACRIDVCQMYSQHTGKPIAKECLIDLLKGGELINLFADPYPKRGLISDTCTYDYSIEGQLEKIDNMLNTDFKEQYINAK